MLRDEKCMKCGALLFEVVPLPDGVNLAMCDETPLDIKSDGADRFFECPHCGAKNIIEVEHPQDGPPQFEIVSWK